MIRRRAATLAVAAGAFLAIAAPAAVGAEAPCSKTPKSKCYGVESLQASLSNTEAGAHPDLTATFDIKKDPTSAPNSFGLNDAYAPTRNVRIEMPPGLLADPSVLGVPQQCTAVELATSLDGGGCPNASQIGIAEVYGYGLNSIIQEPIYMMQPPGGEVVARVGIYAGLAPLYVDATVRTDGDYGANLEIVEAPTLVSLIRTRSTVWGIPASHAHDTERCTPVEVFESGCKVSPKRPAGDWVRALPFITNPTRCGVPLEMRVGAASWVEPERFDFKAASFPAISGCDRLPYGPGLTIEPTNHRAGAPTGLDITARVPASDGVEVLEPSQTRDVRVVLPEGMAINTSAADGLDVCSKEQVHFGKNLASECPDAAKLAGFEIEIPALPRRMKGAIYLREPEPGNLFRFWAAADDLGTHVKLTGQLNVDEQTGQLESTVLEIPQAPVRELKLVFKSGFRAPLVNPPACGTYASRYEFTPWSGGAPVVAETPMTIDEGCEGLGGFNPKLEAGSMDPTGGARTPFAFTLTREDGEQNPASLEVTLPKGLTASLAGVPRCEGAAAETGQCPAASRIGRVIAAAGAGAKPLWVPQPGKRPTAVYLAGPYKGAPLSVVAVVPAQAGPFDLGDEVVRSAIFLDPVTAQGTVRSDPLPQIIEGVPVRYRTVQVLLDREGGFTVNPTSCAPKSIEAKITSAQGAVATPSSPFTAVNCAKLGFRPKMTFRLFGGTHRGSHPSLRTRLTMPPGGANISSFSVALSHAQFLDQAHIRTVCTRVQFAAKECPPGAIYGTVRAISPILDEPLEGPIYLRSSNNPLPDMVATLKGPPSLPVEVHAIGRIDSVNGAIRSTFDFVPDAPVTEIVARLPGGKKGLIVNSRDLCDAPTKATLKFVAQNGRKKTLRPPIQASCKSSRKQRTK